MSDERWAQISRVCHEALTREGARRADYLDEACGTDADLRREVDALLAKASEVDGFLAAPAWEAVLAGAGIGTAAVAPPESTGARPRLAPGTRLGHYEVLEFVGAGGMGEVYRARDSRLDRVVALKRLVPDLAAGPDLAGFGDSPGAAGAGRTPPGADSRAARFAREAKALAQLNHPNICTLHDIAAHDGDAILVMEYLQGGTLAARLRKRPLPLAAACELGAQIADALAAAHSLGIVHRDLKPANIMLTGDATGRSGSAHVKLLDFGLSTFTGLGERKALVIPDTLPTQAEPLTAHGTVVGTLAYMAPEQLQGKPADPRTDIWGLGAILYEMIAGRPAFASDSAVSLMGSILESQPPALSSLRPETPPTLERLVMRCLAKERGERWQSALDVAAELRWLREPSSGAGPVAGIHSRRRPSVRTMTLAAIGLSLAVAGAGAGWLLRAPADGVSPTHPSLDVGPADELSAGGVNTIWLPTPGGSRTALAWTPDGQALVFVGRRDGVQQLYVRRLDAAEADALANTDGAQAPAVAPDGQWVAFWARRAIWKVPLRGGPAMMIARDVNWPPRGLAWDDGGRLYFARGAEGVIWQVPPDGGAPSAVATGGHADTKHGLPWPLPGGRALLYTLRTRQYSWGGEEVVAYTLATGERKTLLKDASDARYLPTGHLVFMRGGTLYAVPFDAERLEIRGAPVAVLQGVAEAQVGQHADDCSGAGQFAVSPTGTLAWIPGPGAFNRQSRLVAVDRAGRVSALPAPARDYGDEVRLSPDGRRLAVTIKALNEVSPWLYDLGRGTLAPLAGGGEAYGPAWTPDGQRLLFFWMAEGRWSLVSQPADGTAPPQVLRPGRFFPASLTPDGRHVATVTIGIGDIVVATLENGQASVPPLTQAPRKGRWPVFSPDGRWLAYGSSHSGRDEVYVQPYPGPGATEQVSVDGGYSPAWNPGGRELLFLRRSPGPPVEYFMMAAEFRAGPPVVIGQPRRLFSFNPRDLYFACAPLRCYDVSPDGQRFYVVQTPTPPPPPVVTHIKLALHWFDELKAKVPAAR